MNATANILLVSSDEAASSVLKEELVGSGEFLVCVELNAKDALETFRQNSFDLVLVKLNTQDSIGIDLIKNFKKADPDSIIIVYGDEVASGELKEISKLDVYDFINEPITPDRLFFVMRKGMQLHSATVAFRRLIQGLREQNISLQKQNDLLAKRLEESAKNLTKMYEDLRTTYMRTIKALAQAIDTRDHYTHSHSENVAKYAVVIAKQMELSNKDIEMIREACELHDLGKIGIRDDILSKPSELTSQEWTQIKRHPFIGAQILEPLTFLEDVIDLVRQHHEHYDGSGYPEGRQREDILLGARIINLADAYEAMRSARSYRKAPLSKEETISEIKRNAGKQFDPKVVEAFLKIVDKIEI